MNTLTYDLIDTKIERNKYALYDSKYITTKLFQNVYLST